MASGETKTDEFKIFEITGSFDLNIPFLNGFYFCDMEFNMEYMVCLFGSQDFFFKLIGFKILDVLVPEPQNQIAFQDSEIIQPCLHLMKHSNEFIIQFYSYLEFWRLESNNQWKICQYKEINQIAGIVLTQDEQYFYSCGEEVWIWQRKQDEWIQKEKLLIKFYTNTIALSESENIIVLGYDDGLFLLRKIRQTEWIILKKIEGGSQFYIKFILCDIFTQQYTLALNFWANKIIRKKPNSEYILYQNEEGLQFVYDLHLKLYKFAGGKRILQQEFPNIEKIYINKGEFIVYIEDNKFIFLKQK